MSRTESDKKYNKKKPVISFRVTKELYDILLKYKDKKHYETIQDLFRREIIPDFKNKHIIERMELRD